MLAIASLVDVGDIPSKPDISGGGSEGVIATWQEVAEYVQLISEACVTQRSQFGWTGYGKLSLLCLGLRVFDLAGRGITMRK